jgi:hypothetical protein
MHGYSESMEPVREWLIECICVLLLSERMARSDPRDAAVVCHELCCLSTTVFLVSLSPIEIQMDSL